MSAQSGSQSCSSSSEGHSSSQEIEKSACYKEPNIGLDYPPLCLHPSFMHVPPSLVRFCLAASPFLAPQAGVHLPRKSSSPVALLSEATLLGLEIMVRPEI